MATISDLRAEVADEKTVVNGATALIAGLTDRLTAALAAIKANGDATALQSVIDEMKANKQALAAAVATGTAASTEAAA